MTLRLGLEWVARLAIHVLWRAALLYNSAWLFLSLSMADLSLGQFTVKFAMQNQLSAPGVWGGGS